MHSLSCREALLANEGLGRTELLGDGAGDRDVHDRLATLGEGLLGVDVVLTGEDHLDVAVLAGVELLHLGGGVGDGELVGALSVTDPGRLDPRLLGHGGLAGGCPDGEGEDQGGGGEELLHGDKCPFGTVGKQEGRD